MMSSLKTALLTSEAELVAISDEWLALLEDSHDNEPMKAPTWLLPWWRHYGEGRQLCTLAIRDGLELVGLAPMCRRRATAVRIGVDRIEWLGTGEDEEHETCSEYVGLIARRGREQEVSEVFADALHSGQLGPWDEVVMSAMSSESVVLPLLATALGPLCKYKITGGAPFVALPATWDDYLAACSSSQRYLIRRSLKEWVKWAGSEPVLKQVTSVSELDNALEMLARLHEARWQAEDKSGVFASQIFRGFHRSVMEEMLARDALWLAWLEVDDEPVAAVYSLCWGGKVRFYQSGRKTDAPAKARPGLVIHAVAIKEAITRGMKEYDFLGGTARYKMQLSTNVRPLVELSLARPTFRNRLVELGRGGIEVGKTLRELKSRIAGEQT